jgi:hypothetical protein
MTKLSKRRFGGQVRGHRRCETQMHHNTLKNYLRWCNIPIRSYSVGIPFRSSCYFTIRHVNLRACYSTTFILNPKLSCPSRIWTRSGTNEITSHQMSKPAIFTYLPPSSPCNQSGDPSGDPYHPHILLQPQSIHLTGYFDFLA